MIEQHKTPASVSQLRALEVAPEQPIDVGRYINALKRSKLLIVAIVLAVTVIVLALSLALPKTYSASSTILFDESPSVTAPTDAERQLATIQKLLVTRDVLARSAKGLPGETLTSLSGKVHAAVDPTANIVSITASASTPDRAARTANVVAASFLARERAVELARIKAEEARLTAALLGLKGTPGAGPQIALTRERLSELSVSEATAGSELQLADAAQPPTKADSPRPLRNAGFALVAALFVAMLVALGRERIAPRIGEARELERLSGYPILTEIPKARRFRDPEASLRERDAYDALAAVVAAQLPPRRQHVLMVTSPQSDEAKAHVTAGLSRALAQAGETALVIDADMRRPALEQLFGMEPAPGLAEILVAARQGDSDAAAEMIVEPPTSASPRRRSGSLAVLGAGDAASPSLVTPDALEILFGELRESSFTCVILSGPPVMGYPDCKSWAANADALLVVSRPERLHPSDAIELHEQLDHVETPVLGHVVLGGRS